MKEATEKQKNYAYAIADTLELERPVGDADNFSRFIQLNKERFSKEQRRRFLLDPDYTCNRFYPQFGDNFGQTVLEWLHSNLDEKSGLYAFLIDEKIVYIGKSKNLAERIPTSYVERCKKAAISRILYYETANKTDADILEIMLISENKPILNVDCNNSEPSTLFHSGIDVLHDFKEIPLGERNATSL